MSKSQVQRGQILDLTAPSGGVVSGSAYLTGGLLNVAQISKPENEQYSGATEGVYELPKEATTATFAEGDLVYWDDTAKEMDVSASGRYEVGTAVAAAAASDETVKVKLKGFAVPAVP